MNHWGRSWFNSYNEKLCSWRLWIVIKSEKKNRFATVLVNILYCFLTRLWLEQKNNKCFKVDWCNPGKIEDSKKNEIVWILCVQTLLRTFKFKARDLLSWRLPNKEPRFELFASRHYSLIEVAKWKFVMIYLVYSLYVTSWISSK